MPLGGRIEYQFGPKVALSLGSILILTGLVSTFLVFEYSSNPYLLYFSYGALLGSGAGLMYTTPYIIGMRWFDGHHKKGLVSAIIFTGISWSSMMLNFLSTQFVNPQNISIDQRIGFIREPAVLNNVSNSFLELGALCLVLFVFGICFVRNPPNTERVRPKRSIHSELETTLETAGSTAHSLKSDEIQLLSHNREAEEEVTIRAVLMDSKFWNLFLTLFVLPVTYVYSQWKQLNNNYLGIEDDQLLASMGTASAVSEAVARLFWGWIYDKLQSQKKNAYKITMGCIATLSIVFISTWTQLIHIEDYNVLVIFAFFWNIALHIIVTGALTLLPVHTAQVFGTKKGGIVYGLSYFARIGGTLFSMTTVIQTRQHLGWLVMNYFWVGTQCILLLLVLVSKSSYKQ